MWRHLIGSAKLSRRGRKKGMKWKWQGWNHLYCPDILSYSYLTIATARKKRKKDIPQQLYNTGCVSAVNADNLPVRLEGNYSNRCRNASVREFQDRLADCWTSQTATWPQIVGVDLLICGFPPCQTCYTPAACLISLNQIVPYRRKQTM